MDGINEVNLKKEITTLLEEEFGKWLDKSENLIVSEIPERSKIFPMLCGSIVEGFMSKGSDLDFSVIIDDRIERPRIEGRLSETFREFLNKLNEKVKGYGLSHICTMSYKLRTTTYLLEFENCKNPQFRVNYFLFGKLIHPNVKKVEVKKRLATPDDFIEFKKSFQEKYREKYGYKLFQVEKSVLTNPERYSPRRIYREVQLGINTFLMAYGLELEKLTEKMEEELLEKSFEITRSTLMKDAHEMIKQEVKQALHKLFELKEKRKKDSVFKRRRLKFFREKGVISDDEWNKLQRFLRYLSEFVYEPLQNFYEIHVKLAYILRDIFHVDIHWLGLRKDHTYITLHDHEKIKCLDIIPSTQNAFNVYAIFNKETTQNLINKNYEKLIESKVIDSSLGVDLPFKKHVQFKGKKKWGRIHFKLFSVTKDEDIDSLKEKIGRTGLM